MAGKDKFPRPGTIPWDKVKEFRVSAESGAYSFEFDLQGKKQKMTVSVSPQATSFTLSTDDGSPVVHAIQKGPEIKILDFSSKLGLAKPGAKLKGIRIAKKK